MKIVDITEANTFLAEYIKSLSEELIIITNKGEPIAALVNLKNVDLETISHSSNSEFIQMIGYKKLDEQEVLSRGYF